MGARRQHEHESGYYEGSDRESVHNADMTSSFCDRQKRHRHHNNNNNHYNHQQYQLDHHQRGQRRQRPDPRGDSSSRLAAAAVTDLDYKRKNGMVQQPITTVVSLDNDSASVMDADTVISVESGGAEEAPEPQSSGCSEDSKNNNNRDASSAPKRRSSSVQVVGTYPAPTSPDPGWDLIRTSKIKKKRGELDLSIYLNVSIELS